MDSVPPHIAVRCARRERWSAIVVTAGFAFATAVALAIAPRLEAVPSIVITVVALAFCGVPTLAGVGSILRLLRIERLAARSDARLTLLDEHLVIESACGVHYLDVDRATIGELATPRARVISRTSRSGRHTRSR